MLIEPITALPAQFNDLRADARAEGFTNIEALWREWHEESRYFDRPGEMLVIAFIGQDVAGIGGVTEDFIDASWLRMRRFYVRPNFRRQGVGKAIAEYLLGRALRLNRQIVLHTETSEGAAFWQAMGFIQIDREKTTHAIPARSARKDLP